MLGINIGPNKDSDNRLGDYLNCFKTFHDVADYITINISSPNTEGLRDFHDQKKLIDLIVALNEIKKNEKTNIPLLLKISPDIKSNFISTIVETSIKHNILILIIITILLILSILNLVIYIMIQCKLQI